MKQKSSCPINEDPHHTNFLIISKIKNRKFCISFGTTEFDLCLENEILCELTTTKKISQNWRRYE